MVEYSFYTTQYNGNLIAESDWPYYEQQASARLENYKYNFSVDEIAENGEKMAVCAMAETLQSFENATSINAKSVSVGSVSTSYGTNMPSSELTPKAQEKTLYETAKLYLSICRCAYAN